MNNERDEGKKFARLDQYLRIAVGLEIPKQDLARRELVVEIPGMPEVAEVFPYDKRNSIKVYLKLEPTDPNKVQVAIPELLRRAPWGEILFNNTRAGVLVLFGREGEEMPFSLVPRRASMLSYGCTGKKSNPSNRSSSG